ncbi:MAG: hypothetical protein A2X13_01400 [Bacteroidetes bacterium GWC2_33_15]|nr:MAG: hypothetical protein A2X10_08225 [Bacteroidetes bacterium GWA2_33_15]OFX52140.1 MAG: hypothetical protein A2X13_01400 [Bacteroidetes bacterium GWC2_33_15]OFX64294.1 MAG: hypothetical protein A2X15_12220 [Bacteroidetes bacterium GWB2_32_14]OFX67699.1 MAG: hypothetical protein A2X14_06045 [Bacteroidetes bacterium GWD2_33_33]HAN19307.1 hypothetical protein [Bacteroidales bacterium]
MRTIFKILGLFFISSVLLFTSCDEKYDYSYTGDEFIQFKTATSNISESSVDTLTIPVLLAGSLPKSDVTLTLTVTTTVKEGFTFVQGTDFDLIGLDGTNLVIKANTAQSDIQLVVYDNFDEDSTRTVTFTLTDSDGDYVMGLPGSENKKSYVVSVIDDDCAFVPQNFAGTPSGLDVTNFPSQAVFVLDEAWADMSEAKARYKVTKIAQGIFDQWGETVTSGADGTYLIFDNTNPLSPTISMDLTMSSDPDGNMIETNGGDWGYFMYDNTSAINYFATCTGYMEYWYKVDLWQDGALYPGGEGYYSWGLRVTFEL